MNNLVTSNLSHHPGRTLASVIGVAVGVILVVLTVGLVRGQLRNKGSATPTSESKSCCARAGRASH